MVDSQVDVRLQYCLTGNCQDPACGHTSWHGLPQCCGRSAADTPKRTSVDGWDELMPDCEILAS